MNVNRTAVIAGVLAAAIAIAGFAIVQSNDTAAVADNPTTAPPTISAAGTGVVSGTPDLLTVSLGVNSRGATAGEALNNANQHANDLIGTLKAQGIDPKDIATSGLSISPVFDDKGQQITGYQSSNIVTAKLRDLTRAGAVIDAAAASVGNDIVLNGVNFSIENTSSLFAQARKQAVDAARTQAQQLAQAAGVRLGPVQSITENAQEVPSPVPFATKSADAAAGASVPIEPGSQQISLTVEVVFQIVQ
jgi:uncharacterized protein